MKSQDRNLEILGTLYRDEVGDLMLLSEDGLHHVLIEAECSIPASAISTLYTSVHEVDWNKGGPAEVWACDLWEDLLYDTKNDYGDEEVRKVEAAVTKTFSAVILSTAQ